jgi:predicted transcriptional regulator
MARKSNYQNHSEISEAMRIHNTIMPEPKFTLVDLNLLCLVKSFHAANRQCYITNEQLAGLLLSSEKTIRRSIDRLCEAKLIRKELINGKRNNGRYLIYQADKVDTFVHEMHLAEKEM